MTKYYKLLLLVFALMTMASPAVNAQKNNPDVDSLKATRIVSFTCNKTRPVDLFKVLELYVSPESGYWGDRYGTPYNGTQSSIANIKERPYTNGNIFHPMDSGTYEFRFYVTSQNDYCGIKTGFVYILQVDVKVTRCLVPIDADLDSPDYKFCYGTFYDVSNQRTYAKEENPMRIEDLIFSGVKNYHRWKVDTINFRDSRWLPIDVYSDSLFKNKIGTGEDRLIYLKSTKDKWLDNTVNHLDTFYLIIHDHNNQLRKHTITVEVFRESTIELFYNPNAVNGEREFDISENITIGVENKAFSATVDGTSASGRQSSGLQ